MVHRLDIDCLTQEQLHDLREAFAGMYAKPASDPSSFAHLAGSFGELSAQWCRHGSTGFLAWQRACLESFEGALRTVRRDVRLPYWDWHSGPSIGIPEACREPTYVNRAGAAVANPLYSGPRPGGGQTVRRPDIDSTRFDDLAIFAQTALAQSSFPDFQIQLSGAHGSIHGRVGGDMSSIRSAAHDPLLYLHLAAVGRLWATWRAAHAEMLPRGGVLSGWSRGIPASVGHRRPARGLRLGPATAHVEGGAVNDDEVAFGEAELVAR